MWTTLLPYWGMGTAMMGFGWVFLAISSFGTFNSKSFGGKSFIFPFCSFGLINFRENCG
jgi:hypothetical protein